MIDYTGSRLERLTYRRVMWPSMAIAEEYQGITGGSIELSAFSDLRASGSLAFDSEYMPSTHDLVQIAYKFEDAYGNSKESVLATLFCGTSEPVLEGTGFSGELTLESVLRVPNMRCYGMPYVVPAGTNCVAKAVEIIESLGLRTNKPKSDHVLSRDKVFDPDTSFLVIVNTLISMAGYASCVPDSFGGVLIMPYVEPQERDPVWMFDDGARSIMMPEVALSDNSEDMYNACRLVYESSEESLWAATLNNDKNSASSISNRGFERTLYESVTELSGDTVEARLAALKELSLARLIENTAGIEYVEFQHPYVPIAPNDAVSIDYSRPGISWVGAVTNMQISLEVSMPCKTKARRFVRKGFVTETTGGSY